MPRRLILIRHAKALEDISGDDHDRALAPRGLADAAELGAWLQAESMMPELVLCSTARRTRETLAAFPATIPTMLLDKLYLASIGELMSTLQSVDDEVQTLAILAHNPGLHGLLALLTDRVRHAEDMERVVLKFPTAACAVFSLELSCWKDLAPRTALLETLRWPHDSQ